MFLGTSSGAGKTVLAAAMCRYLARSGASVAPFKGSNLSSRSYATADGGEIGVGQAVQALAAGAEPSADMNPVLLKPSGGGVLAVVRGAPRPDPEPGELARAALRGFDSLESRFDAVVCEGSGSPAELNLMDRDIANLHMVRERRIPSILVGDIERGGAFAAIYGTWLLVPEDVRGLLRGFVVNRFRGDPGILAPAIARLESLTGMRCLGVVPLVEVRLPEEDVPQGPGAPGGGWGRVPEEADAFIEATSPALDYGGIRAIMESAGPSRPGARPRA